MATVTTQPTASSPGTLYDAMAGIRNLQKQVGDCQRTISTGGDFQGQLTAIQKNMSQLPELMKSLGLAKDHVVAVQFEALENSVRGLSLRVEVAKNKSLPVASPLPPMHPAAAKKETGDVKSPGVFHPGRPIGIMRAGMNCCMNAPLQLIRGMGPVYTFIQDPRNGCKPAIDFYKEYNGSKYEVALTADSQKIRTWVSARSNYRTDSIGRTLEGISPSASVQEDASEVLFTIMRDVPKRPLHLLRATNADGTQTNRLEKDTGTVCPIVVTKDNGEVLSSTSLDKLFVSKFLEGENETRRFMGPPPYLILQIKRFGDWHAKTKINEDLNISTQLMIPARSILKREYASVPADRLPSELQRETDPAVLDCEGFIYHSGSTMRSGHYICYRKIDGVWYEFDDATVTKKSDDWIARRIKGAYILYYKNPKA